MNARAPRGYAGSSGRYAPPAFKIPSSPTTRSSERSIRNPTRTSGPTPSDCKRRAIHSPADPTLRRSASPHHTPPPPVRPESHPLLEPLVQASRNFEYRHAFTRQRASLVLRNEWEMCDSLIRSGHDATKQGFVVREPSANRRLIEKVRVVIALEQQVRAAVDHVHLQLEIRVRLRRGERRDGHVAEVERGTDLVDAERHPHERRAARVAGKLQSAHEAAEGMPGVVLGLGELVADGTKVLGEGGGRIEAALATERC